MSSVSNLPEGIEREEMECDVVIVGGGSAGLSMAYQLQKNIEEHNAGVQAGRIQAEEIPEQMIVVLEKGAEVGAHSLSGAVIRPDALREMIPEFMEKGCPIESEVTEEAVYYLARGFKVKSPILPPPFHNEGNLIVSISKFNRWLGEQCEEKGINIFPGFAAVEALYEGDRIVGVRTGDRGLDKEGKPKANFEPGMILKSKLTIFADGTRSPLFKHVAKKLDLYKGKNPAVFEEGVKEIIQMPEGTVKPGVVIHTTGFPLYKSVGGTFIYTLPGDKIILGLVAYLDTKDPLLDPHKKLQQLKTHPFIRDMIEGGKVVAYGGKTIPAGGWYSMPKLFGEGFMVCGDSAAMVDVQKLKGVHLAMKSGMLAADTALEAIKAQSFGSSTLKAYEDRVLSSYIKKELYRVRNFHQVFGRGFVESLPHIMAQEITGGRGIFDNLPSHHDKDTTEKVVDVWGPEGLLDPDNLLPKPDDVLFFDKLGSVYMTGTMHDEDSPSHLLIENPSICRDVCAPKYNSPCNHFCPAKVYEMVPSEVEKGKLDLQVNFTNCIHCQTCDIKCPFGNIDWTLPEGGGGPQYTET